MPEKPKRGRRAAKAAAQPGGASLCLHQNSKYAFRLFISGTTVRSVKAVNQVKKLLDQLFPAGYSLEVIDLFQQPHLAGEGGVIAAPTLIKLSPPPIAKCIGELTNAEILKRLQLP